MSESKHNQNPSPSSTPGADDVRVGQDFLSRIGQHARELGFQQLSVSDIDLQDDEQRLQQWLAQHYHGSMHFMEKHGVKRSRPPQLVTDTLSIISVRMNYLSEDLNTAIDLLDEDAYAYVSRYALGRDYHKLMRQRLQKLADYMVDLIGPFGYRVFVDSAPVLEKAIARKAGLGWVGKHSNLLNREASSWFFLGEIYTDLPLPVSQAVEEHCGECRSCIDVCPTQAIVEPYVVDARRCISYLTIEHKGSIPVELRSAMGNRIYGCDDCQLFCPWNRFAQLTGELDFQPRHNLQRSPLVELIAWTEDEFNQRMQGSAIRRIGYEQWLRNIAVALGNSRTERDKVVSALEALGKHPSALVREHVAWALQQLTEQE